MKLLWECVVVYVLCAWTDDFLAVILALLYLPAKHLLTYSHGTRENHCTIKKMATTQLTGAGALMKCNEIPSQSTHLSFLETVIVVMWAKSCDSDVQISGQRH